MFTFYRLFGCGMRQIRGYFEDLWQQKKLEIPVPSFGHLCDLFGKLPVNIRHFCEALKARIKHGESVSLILDSTGLRFGKASHWLNLAKIRRGARCTFDGSGNEHAST